MGRKRVTIEVKDGTQLPQEGVIVTCESRGFGGWSILGTVVRVEDIPPAPEPEKVTIVRDDLRALAAIKDVYEYAKKKCDELDICRDIPHGTPPAPEHSCVVTLSGEDLQAYQDGRHAWGFCKCGKSFSLQKPQPTPPPLKPCPFCGGEARIVDVTVWGGANYCVECIRCVTRSQTDCRRDVIASAWNRRVTP